MSELRAVHLVIRPGLPPTAGNAVTAARLARLVRLAGVTVHLHTADALPTARPGPGEVVHALNAVYAGRAALRWASGAPVIWTFTGTDSEPRELDLVAPELGETFALLVYQHEQHVRLERVRSDLAGRVRLVPPGVSMPRPVPPPPDDGPISFLLPAGLRPVKGPDLALETVEAVVAAGLPARLQIAGPARDADFAQTFLVRAAASGLADYLGEVPHRRMGSVYGQAHIILNTSSVEGISNALLEGMAAGRAVLATDIPGNRAALRHDVDGWLASDATFPAAALELARDAGLRQRLAREARRSVQARFSVQAEARAHLELYRAAAAGGELP